MTVSSAALRSLRRKRARCSSAIRIMSPSSNLWCARAGRRSPRWMQLKGKEIGALDQTAALAMLEKTPGRHPKSLRPGVTAIPGYRQWPHLRRACSIIPSPSTTRRPIPTCNSPARLTGQIVYGIAMKKGNTALQRGDQCRPWHGYASPAGKCGTFSPAGACGRPTIAGAFGQPEEPSVPDTEYKAFVASNSTNGDLWTKGCNAMPADGRSCLTPGVLHSGSLHRGYGSGHQRGFHPCDHAWSLVRGRCAGSLFFTSKSFAAPLCSFNFFIIFFGLPAAISASRLSRPFRGWCTRPGSELRRLRSGKLPRRPPGRAQAARWRRARALGMTRRQGPFPYRHSAIFPARPASGHQ